MNIEQHVSATVTLAGRQHTTITTHGDGGQGSSILIAYLGVLISLYDRRAATRYAALWNEPAARIYADRLPAERALTMPAGQSMITLAIRAQSSHTDAIAPVGEGLSVRIGSVRWVVLDQAAFHGQIRLWDKVVRLAELVLPTAFVPSA